MERLGVFAPAARLDGYVPQFLASCARFGIRPVLLGAGLPRAGHGTGLGLLYKYLRWGHDYTHALYVDPRVSVFQRGLGAILAAYRAFDHPLVVSASRGGRLLRPPVGDVPPDPTPDRGPGAGCWIGEVDAVLAMLDAVDPGRLLDDDGSATGAMRSYLLDDPDSYRVDHRCDIFMDYAEGGAADLDFQEGSVFNRATGTYPCILHGNGGADLTATLRALELDRPPRHRSCEGPGR